MATRCIEKSPNKKSPKKQSSNKKSPRKLKGDAVKSPEHAKGASIPTEQKNTSSAAMQAQSQGFQRKRKQPTCSLEMSEALDAVPVASTTSRGDPAQPATAAAGLPLQNGKAQRTGQAQREPSRLAKVTRPGDSETAGASLSERLQSEATPAHSKPAKPAAVASPADGLRTPLLMRNALSSGLGMMLSARTFRSPAPAVTVMEAQECGEKMEMQDSMLYALDGLCGGSPATHRQSALTLAELGGSRRGRLALRSEGAFVEAVATGRRLLAKQWDTVTALGLAAMALAFSRDVACLPALASKEAVQLLTVLLQPPGEEEEEEAIQQDAIGVQLLKLLREGQLSKGLPPEAAGSPCSIALIAVAGCTDPQHASEAMEALKAALRQHGVLEALADSVAAQQLAPESEKWLWRLHKALVVLENCSFACPENETFLVRLAVAGSSKARLAPSLVGLVQSLSECKAPESRLRQECLHCLLSVLMNMTHHNDAGCQQVAEAGGFQAAGRLLAARVDGQSRRGLMAGLDVTSVTLGVLINLAECRPQDVHRLAGDPQAGGTCILRTLCRLVEEFPATQEQAGPAASGELTLEMLAEHEEAGKAAILEVYAALLLGFLVVAKRELRQRAQAALAGGSLAPVVAGVQRCLRFYTEAGAITERTHASLTSLLADLAASA